MFTGRSTNLVQYRTTRKNCAHKLYLETSLILYSTIVFFPASVMNLPLPTYTFCSNSLNSSLPVSNSICVTTSHDISNNTQCYILYPDSQTSPKSVVFAFAAPDNAASTPGVTFRMPLYFKTITAPFLSLNRALTSKRRCLPEGSWRIASEP